MSEVFNFDFDKLQKQGISKEATLNFLREKTENNFNFTELENTYKHNGYTQEQITNALYENLESANRSGDLWLRPLPKDDVTSGNHSADFVDFERSQTQSLASRPKSTKNHESNTANLNHKQSEQGEMADSRLKHDFKRNEIKSHEVPPLEASSGGGYIRGRGDFAIQAPPPYKKEKENIADSSLDTSASPKTDKMLENQQDNTDSKGFFEGILEGIGYETDNVKAINAKADKLLRESAEQGKDLKDLSGAEKRRLYELYNDNKGLFELNSMKASLEKEYNRIKQKQNIAQIKDPKDLTQEQREIIAEDLGAIQNAWNYFFVDEKDTLKEWQDNYKAQSEILPQTQKAIAFLDNIHKHKSISNIIESAYKGEMNKEAFEDYLDEVEKIATTAGFDEIGYNKKGELYFYKGENAYKVNQGFFDNFTNILSANAGSFSGGIAGMMAGARAGTTPHTRVAGAILGGGAGAFLGGGADVLITNAYLNRENNLDELIRHATEEGAMSIVGDVAIAGIVKYGGKALNKAKDMPLGKVIDYTPLLGFAKRAVDGNASSAQKLIDKTYTQEQMLSLKEAGESFGANLSFNGHKGKNPFKSTFGEDSSFTKSYDFLQNALSLPTQRARQQEFIQAIRADESGQLLAFLSEASAQSPKAYDNMRSILNATSFQVKKQLDNLNLDKGDIKAVFDELESGTKQSYDEAINKIIGGIYNDSYKVNLNELKREAKELPTNKQTFKVQPQEIDDFQKHFNFKNKKPLLRELRENEITHALKSHGDEIKETQRGNIAITRADIEANYPRITQEYDERFFTNRSVIYVKQVNGYHIGIEEALLGQDKLIFKSLWKTKGNYNREVLLKNAKANPYPHNADEVAKSESISNPSLEQGYPQQYHLSTPNSTTNKVFNQGEIKFDNAQSFLEKIPADTAPTTLTKQEIEKLLSQFDNIENLTEHLNTRVDSQTRQELFHLLESTKNNPNIHYTKDNKDKYLKRFKDNDKDDPYFYLLVTKDKDKTFITHLKTRDLNYLEKEILNAESIVKGADIIGDFRQQAGSAKHKSPTSITDSTTNKVFNQGEIKFDSLENFTHFAKLSGFENLPQEKLQSAHKYILENLHKLEC